MGEFYVSKIASAQQWCIILGIVLLSHFLTSAQTLQKPLEGDSLSYAAFVSSEIGWMSFDVEQLNTSLKNSNLNPVDDNAMVLGMDTKISVGKGFLFGSGLYYVPPFSSVSPDTLGDIRTDLSSFGAHLRLGYSFVQNSSFLVVPSVGLGFGFNSMDINRKNTNFLGIPSGNLRGELDARSSSIVEYTTLNINLGIGIEGYFKVLSLGLQETVIQDKPNTRVSAQTRGEIWLGGYVSFNPCLTSVTSNGIVNNDSRGFAPSGMQYGIRLMATTALRYIVP
ncbi:MAG: hypothetical protein IPM69_14220 [Ignavibacteria bacterium]|nr:hypothetical protein [Ignavibacteria bacterium]